MDKWILIKKLDCQENILEFLIDDTTYFVYGELHRDSVVWFFENKQTIITNIKDFLQAKIDSQELTTKNNQPLIVQNEIIMFFSTTQLSLQFSYTNIIGALEVGMVIDIEGLYPVNYTLLDELAGS